MHDDIIHSLMTHEAPTVTEAVEDVEANLTKELHKRIKSAGSLPLLCELIQAESHHFNHRLTSQALHRLSILCHAYFTQLQSAHLTSQEVQQAAWQQFVDPALHTLGQLLLQQVGTCDAWTVAISIWAYGNLQCSDEAVLSALSERGLQLLHSFSPVDCASALQGLARLRARPRSSREFVDQLLQHTHLLLGAVEGWSTQEVTSIVWALSKLGAAGPARRPLLEGLVEMVLWRLRDFKANELVIILSSLGRLRLRLPLQLVKLTNALLPRMSQLGPQDAANLVWACAKLDFKSPALLEALPHVVVDRLSTFKPQEVCNLLYGYGHLRHPHPQLLEAAAKACTPRLHEFSTQDLCLTIWAYGALGYCPSDLALFDAACRVLLARKERLLPMQLTMCVKGFAKTGYQPPPAFMQQVAQLSLAKLQQFTPLEFSQLLWAYATAGYRDVQLFEAVVGHTIQQLQAGNKRLSKTTLDTVILSCQRVGFWPQLLVDTAEMQGLYVKAQRPEELGVEPQLLPSATAAAAMTAAAAAPQHASAPAVGAAAAAAGGLAGVAGEASSGSSSSGDDRAQLADALAGALAAPAVAQAVGSPARMQQQGGAAKKQQQHHQHHQQQQPASIPSGSSSSPDAGSDHGAGRPPQQQQHQRPQQPRQQLQRLRGPERPQALQPEPVQEQEQQRQRQPPPQAASQQPMLQQQQDDGMREAQRGQALRWQLLQPPRPPTLQQQQQPVGGGSNIAQWRRPSGSRGGSLGAVLGAVAGPTTVSSSSSGISHVVSRHVDGKTGMLLQATDKAVTQQ